MAGRYGAGASVSNISSYSFAPWRTPISSTGISPAVASVQFFKTPWKYQVKSQADSGSAELWNVATQSFAVTGLPSLHISPSRILKVQVMPSSELSHDSAAAGWIAKSLSTRTKD